MAGGEEMTEISWMQLRTVATIMNDKKSEITNYLKLSLGSELTAFEAMQKAQAQRQRFCPVCGKIRCCNFYKAKTAKRKKPVTACQLCINSGKAVEWYTKQT